jgi:hypothetical protein
VHTNKVNPKECFTTFHSSDTAVRGLRGGVADGAPPGFPGVWDGSDGVRMGIKDMSDLIRPGCEDEQGVNGGHGYTRELWSSDRRCRYINKGMRGISSSLHHLIPVIIVYQRSQIYQLYDRS